MPPRMKRQNRSKASAAQELCCFLTHLHRRHIAAQELCCFLTHLRRRHVASRELCCYLTHLRA